MAKTVLKTSYYGQPTSKWLRILGDFLNYLSASSAVYAVIQEDKFLSILFIIIGSLGKAITNAFTTQGE